MAVKPGKISDLSVLVVDDEADICQMIRYALNTVGIGKIHIARDGLDAWREFYNPQQNFDLVISDWMMPEMSGLDLLKRIREYGSDVPFVMLTSKADEQAVSAAAKAGVTGYIGKPFDVMTLMSRVRAIARGITG